MRPDNPYTIFRIGDLIHIEWTSMLFVLLVFSITIYLMNKLLFSPILHNHRNIVQKSEQQKNTAAALLQKIKDQRAAFDLKKKQEFDELARQRENALKEARDNAAEIISEARTHAKKIILESDVLSAAAIKELEPSGTEDSLKEIAEIKQLIAAKISLS